MIDPILVDLGNPVFRFEWTMDGWGFALLAFLFVPYLATGLTALAQLLHTSVPRTAPTPATGLRPLSLLPARLK